MDKQDEIGSGNHADSTGNSKTPGRNLVVISRTGRFWSEIKSVFFVEGEEPKRLNYLIFFLACISFYTTNNGVFNFLKEEGLHDGFSDIWIVWFVVSVVVWLFVGIFVAVITYMMVFMLQTFMRMMSVLWNWVSPPKIILIVVLFFSWGMLFTISVSFSYAYIWERVASGNVASDEANSALKKANDDLASLRLSLRTMNTESKNLANQSEIKAYQEEGKLAIINKEGEVEIDTESQPEEGFGGDTCGRKTKLVSGPRARMRVRLAEDMRNQKEKLNDLLKSSKDPFDKLESAWENIQNNRSKSNPANQVQLIQEANKKLTIARQNYKNIIEEIDLVKNNIADWKEKFGSEDNFTDTLTGQKFPCIDDDTVKLLESMSNRLDNIPKEIPSVDLKDYAGATATREAINRVFFNYFFNGYRAIWHFVTKKRLGRSVPILPGDEKDGRADLPPSSESGENGNIPKNGNTAVDIPKSDWLSLILAFVVDIGLIISIWLKTINMSLLDRVQFRRKSRVNIRDEIDGLYELISEPHYRTLVDHLIRRWGRDYFVIPTAIANRTPEQEVLLVFLLLQEARKVVSRRLGEEGLLWHSFGKKVEQQNPELYKKTSESRFVYIVKSGAMYDIISSLSEKKPTSPAPNEEMDGEPTSPAPNEEMDGEPTSPDQNEEMDGEPTSPYPNEEMDGEPASPDQNEEMDGEPTSPYPNKEMDGEPTSPDQNEGAPDEKPSGTDSELPSGNDPKQPSGH